MILVCTERWSPYVPMRPEKKIVGSDMRASGELRSSSQKKKKDRNRVPRLMHGSKGKGGRVGGVGTGGNNLGVFGLFWSFFRGFGAPGPLPNIKARKVM